ATNAAPVKMTTLAFLRSGYMMVLDPIGGASDECGELNNTGSMASPKPGLELGVFNYQGETKKFLRRAAALVDTNGCVGMWGDSDHDQDTEYTLSFSEDGNRVTFTGTVNDE